MCQCESRVFRVSVRKGDDVLHLSFTILKTCFLLFFWCFLHLFLSVTAECKAIVKKAKQKKKKRTTVLLPRFDSSLTKLEKEKDNSITHTHTHTTP